MTILPHAASRHRPSADLLAQKLSPLQPQSDLLSRLHRSCLRPYSRESHSEARDYGISYLSQVRGALN